MSRITSKVHCNRSIHYTIEVEGRSFEVGWEPLDGDEVITHLFPDGRTVLGYLVHDEDCENPLEFGDCMGKIYSRLRASSREQKIAFYNALGMDSEGEKVGKRNRFAILLDVYQHSSEVWRVHGGCSYFPDEQWDVSNRAGVWVPDRACLEHIQMKAGGGSVSAMFDADPVQITAEAHHSDIGAKTKYWMTYGYTGGGIEERKGYKTPLTATRAAARALGITFDQSLFDKLALIEAVNCAKQAVDEFNKWLSGECYDICVESFDAAGKRIDYDICGGHIGFKYAKECLEAAVAIAVKAFEEEVSA